MANDSPRYDYRTARKRLDKRLKEGKIPERDYNLITEFLDAFDGQNNMVSPPKGQTAKEPSTLKCYCSRFTWSSVRLPDSDLATATTDDINQLMDQHISGDNPHIKDGGYANATVRIYQSALRSFYHYHDDLDVEPEEITLVTQPKSKVDERDMFTPEEIERLRESCRNPRDRCLLELLINTGQRIRAIQTLRIKDIDVENGIFYLNDTADGLKYAEGKRPLLGARASVRRYLDYHPCPDDPEAYLLTHVNTSNPNTEPGDSLHSGTLARRLKIMGEDAGVTKPLNPHNFRHYFVTIAKKRYKLDNDQIRWLIGHGPDSSVMETTYSHLTDDDRIKSVEIDAGYREAEEENSPLTPPVCPTCGEPLQDSDKACSSCGELFTPDARSAKEQIDADMKESYKEAGRAGDGQAIDDIEDIDKLLENPAVKKALIEKLKED